MVPEAYTLITQPTLLVHVRRFSLFPKATLRVYQGERNELCPKQYAENLASQLTGVEDGAVLYTVKGMSHISLGKFCRPLA